MSLGETDHLITKRTDSDFIADVIAAWSRHYLSVETQPTLAA